MTNILLVCSGGMSTSMLAERMQKEAEGRGLDAKIWAVGEQVADNSDEIKADVILVGPQMRFKVPKIKKSHPDIPVDSIDMRDYGMMNGAAVLDKALSLIG